MSYIHSNSIRALREEALAAGDLEMAAICELALGYDLSDAEPGTEYNMVYEDWTREEARQECARVIDEANR